MIEKNIYNTLLSEQRKGAWILLSLSRNNATALHLVSQSHLCALGYVQQSSQRNPFENTHQIIRLLCLKNPPTSPNSLTEAAQVLTVVCGHHTSCLPSPLCLWTHLLIFSPLGTLFQHPGSLLFLKDTRHLRYVLLTVVCLKNCSFTCPLGLPP